VACVGWSGMLPFYAIGRVHRFAAASRFTGRRWLWGFTVDSQLGFRWLA
jgi:hypothetical protein